MKKKKLLSLALALIMCLGLTVPAFAASSDDYSANGYTDPTAENVNFSVAPIGVAKIRWVIPDWGTREYTAYVFDQNCTVTRKDGVPLALVNVFDHTYGFEALGRINSSSWWPYQWIESATLSADIDNGMLFQFAPDSTSEDTENWSPFMISKKSIDLFPIEYTGGMEDFLLTGTVLEYRPLSIQPSVPTVGGFTDVKTGDYFAEPVLWAVEKKITAGTSKTTFSPNENCSVAQILTFLWRANGSPEPTTANPFSDVKSGDYYVDAAAWAYEKGLVSGTTFGGNTPCTRSMAVTYMWKAAGSPSAEAASFADVSAVADYAQAVAWAVERGVTAGTSATTFSPDSVCTRGQIVTFLYRAFAN